MVTNNLLIAPVDNDLGSDEPIFLPECDNEGESEEKSDTLFCANLDYENLHHENQDVDTVDLENRRALEISSIKISSKEISSYVNINHINQSSENENPKKAVDRIDGSIGLSNSAQVC